MKILCFTLLMLVTVKVSAAVAASEENTPSLPRLTQLNAFPEKYRAAVRAVISALSADGGRPTEYFAEISPGQEGSLEFYLRHQNHPADDSGWFGDACSRCYIASYNPKTHKVSELHGIR